MKSSAALWDPWFWFVGPYHFSLGAVRAYVRRDRRSLSICSEAFIDLVYMFYEGIENSFGLVGQALARPCRGQPCIGPPIALALPGLPHCAPCIFCGLTRIACACVRWVLSQVWCARVCLKCIILVAYKRSCGSSSKGVLRAGLEERCATTIGFQSGTLWRHLQRNIREASARQISPSRFRI